jgi:UDP-N-acetylglucosamine 3-dehydrogenase
MSNKAVVIGAGEMGSRHLRLLKRAGPRISLMGVFDTDSTKLERATREHEVRAFRSLEQAIDAADVVFVSTPTVHHAPVATEAIRRGRHVFVEKPLADTVESGEQLVREAAAARVTLVVGHTERFNPAVRALAASLQGERVLSVNIERVGPRPPRVKDVGILTDLGVHDLDLIEHLSGSPIQRVRCVAKASQGALEDLAHIAVETESGVIGAVTTNWLTPFKSRRILVATERAAFSADLMRFDVRAFRNNNAESSNSYSVDELPIQWREPLEAQLDAFLSLLDQGPRNGLVMGEDGLRVLRTVRACREDGLEA